MPARPAFQALTAFHNIMESRLERLPGMSHIGQVPTPATPGMDLLHLVWFALLVRGWVPLRATPCDACRSAAESARGTDCGATSVRALD